jgi:hypothetical protein
MNEAGERNQRLDDLPALDSPARCRCRVDDLVIGPDRVVPQRLGRCGRRLDGDVMGLGP